ncbi:MAG: hypothetical protein QXW37_00285 [Candidatus Nitrosotenuis sp.]
MTPQTWINLVVLCETNISKLIRLVISDLTLVGSKLWTLTVVAALSTLLILIYFVMAPLVDKKGTIEQTHEGLGRAIDNFDDLKDEIRYGSANSSNFNT